MGFNRRIQQLGWSFKVPVFSAGVRVGVRLIVLLTISTGSWAQDGGGSAIEEVIVTAQRTAESIQDVPIAVTALTGDMLDNKQVITVSDLQMNAPNVSFTSTNFGSSSFSIRGIGRLVTAATGDAGVSIHTNEISLGPNLNTAEFYDMERVEILRGPQGTLYGKNATGGVVNFVTRKPDFESVNGFVDLEGGDYDNFRAKGAINIPLADNLAIRVAGMTLNRDGYTENTAAGQVGADGRVLTGLHGSLDSDVDGRDQYDYRITAAWDINDQASLWVMYNKQKEDSNRARVTNQVCTTNPLPTYGCEPNGNGSEQPYHTSKLGPVVGVLYNLYNVDPDGTGVYNWERPDDLSLREMHSDFDPIYEADMDQYSFGFEYEFDNFTLGVVGGYFDGLVYLTQQDYNMDVGNELPPNFYRADGLWPVSLTAGGPGELGRAGNPCNVFDGNAGVIGGVCEQFGFTQDFQFDQADFEGEGWTYEVKLQSNFDGRWNFLVGYTQFDSEFTGNYYVNGNALDGRPDRYPGFFNNFSAPDGGTFLEGSAIFSEVYFDISEDIKLTFGLRYNEDEKSINSTTVLWNATDVNFPLSTAVLGNLAEPLWTRTPDLVNGEPIGEAELALINLYAGGADLAAAELTAAQSPERMAISQMVPLVPQFNEARVLSGSPETFDWQETTGRLGIDWQVNNDTLLYAFLSRGYKPGGANPAIPPEFQSDSEFDFEQEDIDAFEIGMKNTLLDGTMILNASLFVYDYEGLQVARIKNNTSLNENIDAEMIGAEVEMFWRVENVPGLELDFTYSWLHSEVVDTVSVDPTNRTADDPDWITMNGIGFMYAAPIAELVPSIPVLLTAGVDAGAVVDQPNAIDPTTGIPLITARAFLDAIGVTNVEGLPSDLDGNQLPNSPEHTIHLGLLTLCQWTLQPVV